ncbi:hypothetical protein DCS_06087 [Drechmeria coniospora]|uniref:Uncharacterized protein n=1 Tax=Drechmeria coniospora TaxID=98403 RepID=A0A151GAL3_DRECN|nr:hypothetical protein DCS_06087 [Drechmeria coniospora]KYK54130.1 hypothetical protein DCS_06087 [Drechmeria coniospora]
MPTAPEKSKGILASIPSIDTRKIGLRRIASDLGKKCRNCFMGPLLAVAVVEDVEKNVSGGYHPSTLATRLAAVS